MIIFPILDALAVASRLEEPSADDWRGDEIRYPLKRKNYDELILSEAFTPRILVLVTSPRDIREWLSLSPDPLILRRCGF
jgi:hypothetical protein